MKFVMCVCAHVCVWVHTCVEARGQPLGLFFPCLPVYGDEGLLLNLEFTNEVELTGQQASGMPLSLFDDLASHTQEGPQLGEEMQSQLPPGKGSPSFSHNHVPSVLVFILNYVYHGCFELTECLISL